MNFKLRSCVLLTFSLCLFTACDDEEDKPRGKYDAGAFVINEGVFQAGNGSITHYNIASATAEQNIFSNNALGFSGDVAQSLKFTGDKALLVLNGDSKIEVINGSDFTSITTISGTDIDKPRYVEVIDNKAYISVWGAYDPNFLLIDSYVLVYDLDSNTVVTKIDTDEGTENLIYDGQRLFASNFNYGASSTISVINPSDNSFVDNIEVSAGPAGMVLDANNKLWVVCVGAWDAVNGYLFRINPATLAVEEEITITGVPGSDLAVTPDKQEIVYHVGTSVYSIDIDATTEASEPLFIADEITSISTLNIHPATGDIWLGDSPSFSAIGKVYIYSTGGEVVNSFDTGILPTQIVFR